MSFWKLEEARLLQYATSVSAANADTVTCGGGVPAGKVWIILAFGYMPSVAETQTIGISKIVTSLGYFFGLLNPSSMALNPASATFIEQGMEYILFPGELIYVFRGNHTAGSTMQTFMQYVEIDLPLYTYDEPQEVKRQKSALSSIRARLGGGSGARGGAGVAPIGGMHGGRGTPPAI